MTADDERLRLRADLWARRGEAHVAPLVALADRLAAARGLPVGVGAVPYPDPDGAGVRARVLFLLNDPGEGALHSSGGTGMLSMINNDPTTTRQLKAIQASGFDRGVALHWNGVPWPVAKRDRDRHVPLAAKALDDLLKVLRQHGGELRAVVTLGTFAGKVWTAWTSQATREPSVQHYASAHPVAWGAGVQDRLDAAYRWAAKTAAG
jgi:hypothetical protein